MIIFGDALEKLPQLDFESIDLIYIDPPFNTGKRQERNGIGYDDQYDDFAGFLVPHLQEAWKVLKPNGTMFVHLDWREVHYIKVKMDRIFGRPCFLNEIIWAYDYGARSKKKWPTKHDNILVYVKNPKKYTFNFDEMDRIPYMAPGLVGKEKAARGKTPTDVFWHSIIGTNSKERRGYPTQKPMGLIRRFIKVHSNPGDVVLDFFAGSGTTGAVAKELDREYIMIDSNPDAILIMERRGLGRCENI